MDHAVASAAYEQMLQLSKKCYLGDVNIASKGVFEDFDRNALFIIDHYLGRKDLDNQLLLDHLASCNALTDEFVVHIHKLHATLGRISGLMTLISVDQLPHYAARAKESSVAKDQLMALALQQYSTVVAPKKKQWLLERTSPPGTVGYNTLMTLCVLLSYLHSHTFNAAMGQTDFVFSKQVFSRYTANFGLTLRLQNLLHSLSAIGLQKFDMFARIVYSKLDTRLEIITESPVLDMLQVLDEV